ncbi:MAG: thiamine-phosphate kinase [Candidatus Omnitrophota bacterium]
MSEREFVDYLKRTFPFDYGVGIGDDASVVPIDGSVQLITKDILIENEHFRLEDCTLHQLALKALAVNISDIAAMGGKSQYFYLGLGYPRRLARERVIEFFNGLADGCRRWTVQLAGGDYSASRDMFISITLVGMMDEGVKPVQRNGAKVGDLVGITAVTGESAIGLKLLFEGIGSGYFVDRHFLVEPEVEKGPVLARYVNAMIDVSDGLLLDLSRVLDASQKGARIDYGAIPVTTEMKTMCREKGWREVDLVLSGGEDYRLLFTISPESEARMKGENKNLEYYIIGEINDQNGSLIVEDRGKVIEIPRLGYDHFVS